MIGSVKKTASYDSIDILVAKRLSMNTKMVAEAVASVSGKDIFPISQKWVEKFFKVLRR